MRALRLFALVLALRVCGSAYSVLSHEAIVDALWDVKLKHILLARFPSATPEQLKEAHGYAYGGAIIQDMGYYPHANGYFSDLTHYVRSGDFIVALLKDSQTLDDYAFALGALSHYGSDNNGHRLATNVGEPLMYPKLRRKFGNVVTYADAPDAHLQTEYAFDVEQVVKGNYAPGAYHDFIGFNVATTVLQQAFRETYGFELREMFGDFDQAVGSYRHTLSTLIPFFTRVAWADHQGEITHSEPGMTRARFLYRMKRSSYEREWGKKYDRPSFFDRIIAVIVKILPPIGRLKILKFRPLTPGVEKLFMNSFDAGAREYGADIDSASKDSLRLPNTNFDVGVITRAGDYTLQDQTYADWLARLERSHFAGVTPEIAADINGYYRDLNAPIDTKKHPKQWAQVLLQLQAVQKTQTVAADPHSP